MQKLATNFLAVFLVALTVVAGLVVLAAGMIAMAMIAMAFWALLIGGLGWLLPGIMEPLRAMVSLQDFSFWQIGAGVGLVMVVLNGVFGMAKRNA